MKNPNNSEYGSRSPLWLKYWWHTLSPQRHSTVLFHGMLVLDIKRHPVFFQMDMNQFHLRFSGKLDTEQKKQQCACSKTEVFSSLSTETPRKSVTASSFQSPFIIVGSLLAGQTLSRRKRLTTNCLSHPYNSLPSMWDRFSPKTLRIYIFQITHYMNMHWTSLRTSSHQKPKLLFQMSDCLRQNKISIATIIANYSYCTL